MDLLRTDPEFAERFLTYTLTRGICIEADLGSRGFDYREKRLTRMREKRAWVGTGWTPIPAAAMMSPESMAGIIGTTSSNVRLHPRRISASAALSTPREQRCLCMVH